jgi:hypothetical protein
LSHHGDPVDGLSALTARLLNPSCVDPSTQVFLSLDDVSAAMPKEEPEIEEII